MQAPVDQERFDDYQSRVTTWIGRQGLFFQIRYLGLTRGGSFGARLVSLFAILTLVALGAFLLFLGGLKVYQKSESYQERVEARLGKALGATELSAKGYRRVGGNLEYQVVYLTGGEKSFFYEGKLSRLEGEFPFFTGVWSEWAPETLLIDSADFRLKAGGGDEEMRASMSGILESFRGSPVTRIKIKDLSCEWGYSKLTLGGIYNATFDAVLSGGKWTVTLAGGKFRQNWLGPFEIETGEFVIDDRGVKVDSLTLKDGGGTLNLRGRIGGPPGEPGFDLTGRFTGLPVENLFNVEDVTESGFIEGAISGDLKVSGSTNRRIKTTGRVVLGEGDELLIRDQWTLLRAISAVVKDGTYLRIGFQRGGFDFTTENGGCEIRNIDMWTDGVARLTGGFATHLPSQQEAADFLGISLTDGFSKSLTDTSSAKALEDDRISISRAARTEEDEFEIQLINEADSSVASRVPEWDGVRLKREMAKHRFNGDLRLGLPNTVLSENERAAPFYPADEEGWSWIPLALNEVTFSQIGEEAGEKLRKEGRDYTQEEQVSPDE